jgi:hypothetical protein
VAVFVGAQAITKAPQDEKAKPQTILTRRLPNPNE